MDADDYLRKLLSGALSYKYYSYCLVANVYTEKSWASLPRTLGAL